MHCCVVFVSVISGWNRRPLIPLCFAEWVVSQYASFQSEPVKCTHEGDSEDIKEWFMVNYKSCAAIAAMD